MKLKRLYLNKIEILLVCLLMLGCGVKGRPQAPLVETPIGFGSPEQDEIQQNKKSGTNP